MDPRRRKVVWYTVAAVALAALWAWKTGYLWPEPSLDPSPAAAARGEAVLRARCLHCHATIPLAPRVAGWSPELAYDAIGRLPELRPAMPPFQGTEQERADLAVYLHLLGRDAPGEAPAGTPPAPLAPQPPPAQGPPGPPPAR